MAKKTVDIEIYGDRNRTKASPGRNHPSKLLVTPAPELIGRLGGGDDSHLVEVIESQQTA